MKIHTKVYDLSSQNVISEIHDLANRIQSEADVKKVLSILTDKVADLMQADVCSLYLLDPATHELVLKATKGLKAEAIDRVRMHVGEGLVGKTLEWLKPVSVAKARKSKRFKFFPGTGEEEYSSFLSVPLIYNRHPIGVLVVQDRKSVRYSPRSVHLLLTLAIPTVSLIEKTKLVGSFGLISSKTETASQAPAQKITARANLSHDGIPAAPGIAIGHVRWLVRSSSAAAMKPPPGPLHPGVEKMRTLEAFRWVEEEIREVQKKATKKFGTEELSIFDAYRMVLESEQFKDQVLEEIEKGKSALMAVESVITHYTEELSRAEDDYIRERVYDIRDVGRKITDRLLYGSELPRQSQVFEKDTILLCDNFSISDFVEMDLDRTKGILSASGGASSHIAVLARSLGIPAVLGITTFAELIHDGDTLIIDGNSGHIVLKPSSEMEDGYRKEILYNAQTQKKYKQSAHKPAKIKNGQRIVVGANLGIVAHALKAPEFGAEEIGLYRTEFPFLVRRNLPTEEEQLHLYRKILSSMGKKSVTIRTLDIGGDKYLPYLNLPHEDNPFLGWRSIRISLEREDLFRIQLRALFRASPSGNLKILFPMISSMEEIRRVKEIVRDVKRELKAEHYPFVANVPLGIMIEVPSAIELADSLIKEVNFFSVGTNDLIQYMLAVDRNNPKVAKLFNPLHPAVLRAIWKTCVVAKKSKKMLSVCGDMASHTLGVVLLMGMGITNLSMSAPLISKIKSLISRLDYREVRKLAMRSLEMDAASDIAQMVKAHLFRKGLNEFLPIASTLRP